jgi:hypothetical protein
VTRRSGGADVGARGVGEVRAAGLVAARGVVGVVVVEDGVEQLDAGAMTQ